MESLSNKVADLKVIKKRLQGTHVLSCEYCKIFKNIYFEDHLQTATSACWSILYKEFLYISYENASFGILEDSIWIQLIYFWTTMAFWRRYEISFSDTLSTIYRSNQPLWKIHGIAQINCLAIDESNQVKISREIMRCQGYFLKIALVKRLHSNKNHIQTADTAVHRCSHRCSRGSAKHKFVPGGRIMARDREIWKPLTYTDWGKNARTSNSSFSRLCL